MEIDNGSFTEHKGGTSVVGGVCYQFQGLKQNQHSSQHLSVSISFACIFMILTQNKRDYTAGIFSATQISVNGQSEADDRKLLPLRKLTTFWPTAKLAKISLRGHLSKSVKYNEISGIYL